MPKLITTAPPTRGRFSHAQPLTAGGFSTATLMKKLLSLCRLPYLAYFSQPSKDRVLYRAIRRTAVTRILELGMEQGRRSSRMIEIVRRARPGAVLHYTGVDLFELSSASGGGITLKTAYCKLQAAGARVRLVPGDPFTALSNAANTIGPCDLIVIAANQESESLRKAWFYVPRLLHPATLVFVEEAGDGQTSPQFVLLDHDEIRRRAHATTRRTAA
jgi:hypothetical protein